MVESCILDDETMVEMTLSSSLPSISTIQQVRPYIRYLGTGTYPNRIGSRVAELEPEPAFFGPTGAGAVKLLRLQALKMDFLTVESTYVECKLGTGRKYVGGCRKYVGNM